MVEDWRSAWQSLDLRQYMATYTSDARIFSNKRWYSYNELYIDEATKFAQGGTLHVATSAPSITIDADKASAVFEMEFQRWGGKGNYRSAGIEEFKLRRTESGWRVYEDTFTKH